MTSQKQDIHVSILEGNSAEAAYAVLQVPQWPIQTYEVVLSRYKLGEQVHGGLFVSAPQPKGDPLELLIQMDEPAVNCARELPNALCRPDLLVAIRDHFAQELSRPAGHH